MTVQELAAQCAESIRYPERSIPDKPLVTLVGKHALFPKGGGPRPKRLLCVNRDGDRVWHYDAMNVLAALAAAGLVEVKFDERP